jgi:hypothetical protein
VNEARVCSHGGMMSRFGASPLRPGKPALRWRGLLQTPPNKGLTHRLSPLSILHRMLRCKLCPVKCIIDCPSAIFPAYFCTQALVYRRVNVSFIHISKLPTAGRGWCPFNLSKGNILFSTVVGVLLNFSMVFRSHVANRELARVGQCESHVTGDSPAPSCSADFEAEINVLYI